MNKQPELTAATRKKLTDAYFELLGRGEKTTISTVTALAGYNRCTFYRYFSDIQQLLEQVEGEICEKYQAIWSQFSSAADIPRVISELTAVYDRYGPYLAALLGEHGDARFTVKIKAIIAPVAVKLLTISADPPAVAELKMEFALSAVLATITKWYAMGQPIPVQQLSHLLLGILQNGIGLSV